MGAAVFPPSAGALPIERSGESCADPGRILAAPLALEAARSSKNLAAVENAPGQLRDDHEGRLEVMRQCEPA